MKVSFDFDSTLDRPHIQEYARELIERGLEVWIVTSRYDCEHHRIAYHTTPEFAAKANQDLFEVADKLGITIERIFFTNFIDKWVFFKDNPGFVWHLDDDWVENRGILNNTKTLAVSSWANSAWKGKCERFINKRLKQESQDVKGVN